MPELKIANTALSDMTNNVDDVVVDSLNTDGVGAQDETEYTNTNWAKYWGYFNEIPELKSAMLMKAIWNVGKGWKASPEFTTILENLQGWGKDTFDDILFNMEVTRRIGGDSFAEIIRDEKGRLQNLKPLDPSSIKIVVNRKGQIIKYVQISKLPKSKEIVFKPEEIFHLSNNRLADQIHGISDIMSLEKTILAENETFTDLKSIMHKQARPLIFFKLGTDDPTKIAAFIAKMDEATNKGENVYIPDDDNSVKTEVVQVNVSQMVLAWRNDLMNRFYRALGLPLVIFGAANSTESGSKMEYLAHEQVFEKDQRYIEKQIWNQLFIRIDLIPPTSMLENLQTDQAKDGAASQMNIQPSDVTAGVGK